MMIDYWTGETTVNKMKMAPAVFSANARPARGGVLYCARREFSDSGV